jgi:hypothetical protein
MDVSSAPAEFSHPWTTDAWTSFRTVVAISMTGDSFRAETAGAVSTTTDADIAGATFSAIAGATGDMIAEATGDGEGAGLGVPPCGVLIGVEHALDRVSGDVVPVGGLRLAAFCRFVFVLPI